ncbi:MAG TPA: M20/M25/M40 family metallo-hydrolase [Thermoplasmata archaeon]|nr:M20/M25/M40 family metallo-hydrolase [Thermoplasmata archaeon]
MDHGKLERQLKKDFTRDVKRIQRMIKQPSISGEGRGIRECAALVGTYLGDAGVATPEIVETEGHPVVYGELDAGAKHTLLVYMMYDTQPFAGESWTHPPLDAVLGPFDGFPMCVVGRGAINTKGPMVSFLNALRAAKEIGETLPVNLRFVCEGEEELGSPHLPQFFKENLPRLRGVEAVLYPSAMQDRAGGVKLRLGNKGIVYMELVCSGSRWGRGPVAHDIHSANQAWVDSPVWRLVKALGTMVSDDGNTVKVDGLRDDILGPTPEEHRIVRDLARTFNPDAFRTENKVDHFVHDLAGPDLLERYLYSTTLNIDGIWGGHTGPGTKTVLPSEARARIDVRLVPNQDPEKVIAAIRRHLDKKGFPDVEVEVHDRYPWSQTPQDAPIVRATTRAYEAMGHAPEVWIRVGGSLPMYVFTGDPLRLPAISAGLGYGAHAHAPDEYIVIEGTGRIAGLVEQESSYLRILDAYAQVAG